MKTKTLIILSGVIGLGVYLWTRNKASASGFIITPTGVESGTPQHGFQFQVFPRLLLLVLL